MTSRARQELFRQIVAEQNEAFKRINSSANALWWVADEEKAIERIEKAIQGRADSEMVRLPLGDARPELVSELKKRAAAKREAIDAAKRE